ncbi:MAG: hypothetical protein ACYCVC_05665 [Acidimicrobiales bacterium]
MRARGPARRHPDRRTAWVIVMLAHLEPGRAPSAGVLVERLGAATGAFPLLASRLEDGWWWPASGPAVSLTAGGRPLEQALLGSFDLRREPPLRVLADVGGRWLLLCAHHFAFDGLGMVALLRSLLTGEPVPAPDYTRMSSPVRLPTEAVGRLLTPADRVPPSSPTPRDESFAAREVALGGPGVTARLASACAGAVVAHAGRRGRELRRLGVSVAVGGTRGEAATYRRVDVPPGGDVEAAVNRALAEEAVPTELGGLPPGAFLLSPLLRRLSDTFLVSNLGRVDLPGVRRLEFYPVARGRSAVAFGAAGSADRPATVTVRARDLAVDDAEALLDRVVEELAR